MIKTCLKAFGDTFKGYHFLLSLSEDSDEGAECQETGSESSTEHVQLLYLYIQMEYCGESTLRNLIDEGLHKDKERIWRLFREIVEGLVHIHSQVMYKHAFYVALANLRFPRFH